MTALLALTCFESSAAIVLTNIYFFNGATRLETGIGLKCATDGNFYGTSEWGGDYNFGRVFRITPSGAFSVVASFDGTNGRNPWVELLQTSDGKFYGTAETGGYNGYGTVFRVTTNGVLTALASFGNTNGSYPEAGLCQASDANFYGTTSGGGAYDRGTVFKMTLDGVLTVLHSFDQTNGGYPRTTVVQGRDGKLYGTTLGGGASTNASIYGAGDGTLFSITTNGEFTSLFSFFRTNGSMPVGPLVPDAAGNLYGVAESGGPATNQNMMLLPNCTGYGTVFRLNPVTGQLATLVWFNSTNNGANPLLGLTPDQFGNFYGVTSYGGTNAWPLGDPGGTLFKVTPDGSLDTLHAFGYYDPAGYEPLGALAQGSDGNFYGTTYYSRDNQYGGVFRVSIPLPAVFQSPSRNGNSLTLNWSTVADQTYQLQFTTNLASANWINLGDAVTATNGFMSASDVIGPDSQRFYRVYVLP